MKKDQALQFMPISKEAIGQLITEQKETIATDFSKNYKNFSTVDLWNIHRQHKPSQRKRRLDNTGI